MKPDASLELVTAPPDGVIVVWEEARDLNGELYLNSGTLRDDMLNDIPELNTDDFNLITLSEDKKGTTMIRTDSLALAIIEWLKPRARNVSGPLDNHDAVIRTVTEPQFEVPGTASGIDKKIAEAKKAEIKAQEDASEVLKAYEDYYGDE